MKNLTAIVLGATGATGSELLTHLLQDPDFSKVIVFARRSSNISDPKLELHIVDFDQPSTWHHLIQGDVLFSAMGTTLRQAGSKDAQYKIDYTYPYEAAKSASEHGVKNYVLVSAYGANAKSPFFYPRMKGELDAAVQQLSFEHIHIFRPGVLWRQADKLRPVEKISIVIVNALNTLGLLKSQKPMPVALLAEKMIKVGKQAFSHQVHIHHLNTIFDL